MIRDDRGFTVVGIMVMSLSLLIVVSGIMVFGSATNKRAASEEQRAKAFYAAESGINHVMALLRAGVDLKDRYLVAAPADGESIISKEPYVVASLGDTKPKYKVWMYYDDKNQLIIVSQGEEGTAVRNVTVSVTGGTPPTMEDGEVVDINWPTCGCSINTASKGSIEVNKYKSYTISSSSVYDNITINQNGKLEVLTSSETKVTGKIEVNKDARMTVKGSGQYSLCSNSLQLNSTSLFSIDNSASTAICTNKIAINSGSILELNVNGAVTLCTSDSEFNSNGKIKLARGTNFILWASGDVLEMNKDFSITDIYGSKDQDDKSTWPRIVVKKKLQLNSSARLGTETQRPFLIFMDPDYAGIVELNQSAVIYGAIWAPTRKVQLNNNAEVHGLIIADEVELNGNARVYGKVVANKINRPTSVIGVEYDFSGITIPGAGSSGSGMGIGEYQDR